MNILKQAGILTVPLFLLLAGCETTSGFFDNTNSGSDVTAPPPPMADGSTSVTMDDPEPMTEPDPMDAATMPTTSTPGRVKPGTADDFVANVGDRIYFDLNQATLDRGDQAVLDRQAAWLNRFRRISIIVSGNCDERGTREYNLALGARRAQVVKNYLVSLGVNANRIRTVSYGKERPIDARSNQAAWARNRNAHTQLIQR